MRIIYAVELLVAFVLYYTGVCWLRKKALARGGKQIVLVYHRVLEGRRGLGEPVGETAFAWQMAYLRKHFRPVGWENIVHNESVPRGFGAPAPDVLVTFDDGYRDNFERALPIIERRGIPVVFFTATDFVFHQKPIEAPIGDGDTDDHFPSIDLLKRATQVPFVRFGNHTQSHRIVSRLTASEQEQELTESQRDFEHFLGLRPEVFAFPRGRKEDLSAAVVPTLKQLGIQAAFTMVPGLVDENSDPYAIPRIGLSNVNNRVLFKVKVLGLLNPLVSIKNRMGL